MATLTVRDVPESVRASLRKRAARNGRSVEAEVRAILAEASKAPPARARDAKAIEQTLAEFERLMAKVKVPKGRSLTDEFVAGRRKIWGEE